MTTDKCRAERQQLLNNFMNDPFKSIPGNCGCGQDLDALYKELELCFADQLSCRCGQVYKLNWV